MAELSNYVRTWLNRFHSMRGSNIHQIRNRILYRVSKLIYGTELPVKVPYGPFYCAMGVEARCNLKCTMCPRNDPNFKEGEMPFSLFTMIMAQLPFLKEVQLSGLGEPLLHRDLFKMIRYLRRRRIRSVVVTNGTLLSDEVINEIFRSGLDVLNVSIDSADPEVYASIRVGARLKEIKENVKKLVDRKMREGSKLEVNINSILMRSNYRQVEDMIRLGWELGVDSISFSDIQYSFDVGISKGYESLRLASRREKREIRRLFERAQKLSKELNLRVYLPRLEQPKVRELCKQPWLYLVVKEDGRVRPCCGIHKREFGDLTKEGFKSIWNNDDFRSFRERLLSDDLPLECRHCTML